MDGVDERMVSWCAVVLECFVAVLSLRVLLLCVVCGVLCVLCCGTVSFTLIGRSVMRLARVLSSSKAMLSSNELMFSESVGEYKSESRLLSYR